MGKIHGDSGPYHWTTSNTEHNNNHYMGCGCPTEWAKNSGSEENPFSSEIYHMQYRLDGEFFIIFFDQ